MPFLGIDNYLLIERVLEQIWLVYRSWALVLPTPHRLQTLGKSCSTWLTFVRRADCAQNTRWTSFLAYVKADGTAPDLYDWHHEGDVSYSILEHYGPSSTHGKMCL